MCRNWILVCLGVFAFLQMRAQDTILSRVILIGDAGKVDAQQRVVLMDAANHILPGKTTVFYLGDNIYPSGMALSGSADTLETGKILQSQYEPMRNKGAPVYFIPGNHDWDGMKRHGLEKIKAQGAYLEQQHDPLLKLLPAGGCPGPEEIPVSDSMVIITFDSEWWLFPYDKSDPGATCECGTNEALLSKINALFNRNRGKVILLASHHPFQSYGHHGGYFSLKDHLFPLTALNPNLYIPLPVIGSLYPLLRSTFRNPEDLRHPLYKQMIRQVDSVFEGYPNLIHVSGHEHGLQLIKSDEIQVVSGAGAKNEYVKKGKNSLFVEKSGGYVTVDLLTEKKLRFTYYTLKSTGITPTFVFDKVYSNKDKTD
jgi:hypothetical protein